MKKILFKIVFYLLAMGAGFCVYSLFFYYLLATNGLPTEENEAAVFTHELLTGTIYAWMAGSLAGLIYFWMETDKKYAFLVMPALFPFIYCLYFATTY